VENNTHLTQKKTVRRGLATIKNKDFILHTPLAPKQTFLQEIKTSTGMQNAILECKTMIVM